jgi:hypothetical protein
MVGVCFRGPRLFNGVAGKAHGSFVAQGPAKIGKIVGTADVVGVAIFVHVSERG